MNHRHTLIPPCAAGDVCPGSENDAECVISRIEDADGGIVTLRAFRVFPGITLIYRDVDTRGRIVPPERSGTVFTIEHCLEGQIGFETGSGVCCLSPGDLSILSASDIRGVYFPGESCHGISIEIDTAETPRCLSCFLEDVKVDPAGLMRGFTENGGSYTARSDAAIAHIFSELYSVPESIRRGYFKVKILELLLFLSTVPSLSDSIHTRAATRSQAAMADSMSAYISEHLDERVTIDMLSREFHVSPTRIKDRVQSRLRRLLRQVRQRHEDERGGGTAALDRTHRARDRRNGRVRQRIEIREGVPRARPGCLRTSTARRMSRPARNPSVWSGFPSVWS